MKRSFQLYLVIFSFAIFAANIFASPPSDGQVFSCPLGLEYTEEECFDVMINDPGFMSEESAKKLEDELSSASESGERDANECVGLSGGSGLYIRCEGSSYADTFYIGSRYNTSYDEIAICLVGIGVWYFVMPYENFYKFIQVYGGDGNDEIRVVYGDTVCQIPGTDPTIKRWNSYFDTYLFGHGEDDDDTIIGTPNLDYLYGENDGDYLIGYGGNDRLYGGYGDDMVYCGYGTNDTQYCYGGPGQDLLIPINSSIQYLYGETGFDYYYRYYYPGPTYCNDLSHGATDGNYFKMYNNNYNDRIRGDYGNDIIYTYGGDDNIISYGGSDIIWAGNGEDTISAGDEQDFIYGGDGDDFIEGGNGDDSIVGEGGDDTIYGEWWYDDEEGEPEGYGDDCIVGDFISSSYQAGAGLDNIDGGNGNDGVFCSNATFAETGWCVPNGGYNDYLSSQCSANCYGEVDHSCNTSYYGYCDGEYSHCMPP